MCLHQCEVSQFRNPLQDGHINIHGTVSTHIETSAITDIKYYAKPREPTFGIAWWEALFNLFCIPIAAILFRWRGTVSRMHEKELDVTSPVISCRAGKDANPAFPMGFVPYSLLIGMDGHLKPVSSIDCQGRRGILHLWVPCMPQSWCTIRTQPLGT